MARLTTAPRFLRIREVLQMTEVFCLFIYAKTAEGTFTKLIHLAPHTIVWNERAVFQWMEDRMASR